MRNNEQIILDTSSQFSVLNYQLTSVYSHLPTFASIPAVEYKSESLQAPLPFPHFLISQFPYFPLSLFPHFPFHLTFAPIVL